jgi:hypothetical protein
MVVMQRGITAVEVEEGEEEVAVQYCFVPKGRWSIMER